MRFLIILFAVLGLAAPATAQDKYEFDKSHTRILFYVNHLGFSDTVGEFTEYDGHFTFDENAPEKSTLDVTLKPSGIRTPSAKLDEHLQNKDFFHTSKYPTIRFVSKKVIVTGENKGEITGDLTLLGTTLPAILDVTFNKAGTHPMNGNYIAGFSAHAKIQRSKFGMNYLLPMIGDEVRVEIHTEGIRVTNDGGAANNE